MNVFFSRNGAAVLSISRIFSKRFLASAVKEKDNLDITALEEQPVFMDVNEGLSEEEIENIRNKSGLRDGHRKILHNTPPRYHVRDRYHHTVKYNRKMFGRYGLNASNAPIGISWPTKEEVEDAKEFESVLYPETIHQMWDKIARKKIEDANAIRERDATIDKNMSKLAQWTAELHAKIAKKEAEAKAARDRKERLMEEVRRHFGFQISTKDERFKEMLAQKDKAEKKLKKLAKKQARDKQIVSMFAEKSATQPEESKTEDSKSSENV